MGKDADVVLWDRSPLAVGATPLSVWIEGVVVANTSSSADMVVHRGCERCGSLSTYVTQLNQERARQTRARCWHIQRAGAGCVRGCGIHVCRRWYARKQHRTIVCVYVLFTCQVLLRTA